MGLRLIGTGFYVPEQIVTNQDLEKLVETSDEWITQRVGVRERRISSGESAAEMAIHAAKEAIAAANISPEEIDLIVAATISSDDICPTVAGSVGAALGITCPAFDVNSACSGFVFALDIAEKYLACGAAKKILVIGAERLSKLLDWTDRGTCVIFGDGAGAAVAVPGEMYESLLYTSGGSDVIHIPNCNSKNPFYTAEDQMPYIFMDGQETFKFAVNKIGQDVRAVAEKAGAELSDIRMIIPHQANARIIDYAAKRLKLPADKFYVNLAHYGNTSSASIPMALAELDRKDILKPGDLVVLTAFGGGLSSAACIFKW